ncbi:hypothetical protein [Sphingomonas aerophila]|nr:hypothetical protein [Sphingomonas aerophila]
MIGSADEFVRLRTSDEPDEYRRAAMDEAPESVWLEVVQAYPEMRRWVAHNKTVPMSVLDLLAADQDEDVRIAVAQKRKLTADLFSQLSRDPSPNVRQRIASNAKTPTDVLERLASDADKSVAIEARTRLG